MIKKFKEFIEATKFDKLKDILSMEDVEDQFLRLKEVFNCDIKMSYNGSEEIFVWVGITHDFTRKYLWSRDVQKLKITKELGTIKRRMEEMYPVVVDISSYIKSSTKQIPTHIPNELLVNGYFVVSITPGFKNL